jgi:transposase
VEVQQMRVMVSGDEEALLRQATTRERRVRPWRRLRAIQLLAGGEHPTTVATMLSCSLASVYSWAAAWQARGLEGLRELPRAGKTRALDEPAEHLLEERLASDPQGRGYHATGWTVPMLRAELAQAGYEVGERTIRRTLRRLGWRWKRPTDVLGRPDPEYEAKKGRSSLG